MVAINMSAVQFERVIDTTAKYGYRSVEQFLIAAAWNQIALHEAEQGPHAEVAITPGAKDSVSAPEPRVARPAFDRWRDFVTRVDPAALRGVQPVETYSGPEALLWGQTNRLLPVAVGVRVLANQLARSGEALVDIDDWRKQATEVAQALRVRLEQWDQDADRGRSDQWATAFPSSDPASANRFMGQFLGWPRRTGKLAEGGAIWLGFVAVDDERRGVTLTEAGERWAAFSNPIFDGEVPTSTFSEDETAFFIEHLRDKRPTEFGLLRDVAKLVKQGKSRTQIDTELALFYPEWAKHIATMRAGAMGRMSDLDLLTRERHGLTVAYHLTPLADALGVIDDGGQVR